MKVGSMFAGIGGFDLGFERAGFEVAWCVEWDRNAQAVLRKRFPKATIYGDIRQVDADELERVDVVCGGFPCQDLSVAGKRAGLAGERSGLFHDAMRLVRRLRPSILILENVPGLHSSNRGLDFATVLREVGEGWNCAEVAWRVLDSQYFGVAQRRRRVFIVASVRAECAEQVLALAEGGGGYPPSRDKAREGIASDAARCLAGTCESAIAAPWQTKAHDYSRADGFNIVVGTIDCDIPKQRVQNFCANHWLAFPIQDGRDMDKTQNGLGVRKHGDPSYTIDTTGAQAVAIPGMVVRRLTPLECERLQGFPDGWTDIGTPEKPTADSHRYKQLGNAVTVNVAEWIARRTMASMIRMENQ